MRICFSSFLAVAAFSFSLAVRGQQTAPAQPKFDNVQVEGIKWTTFHDPKENAFSLDVPEGWKVDGGLVRRSNIDTSTFLRVLSPDGAVMLLMGDPGPAVFHLPAFGALNPKEMTGVRLVSQDFHQPGLRQIFKHTIILQRLHHNGASI